MIEKLKDFLIMKVLPASFDNSLSIYELMSKLLNKQDECIEEINNLSTDSEEITDHLTDIDEEIVALGVDISNLNNEKEDKSNKSTNNIATTGFATDEKYPSTKSVKSMYDNYCEKLQNKLYGDDDDANLHIGGFDSDKYTNANAISNLYNNYCEKLEDRKTNLNNADNIHYPTTKAVKDYVDSEIHEIANVVDLNATPFFKFKNIEITNTYDGESNFDITIDMENSAFTRYISTTDQPILNFSFVIPYDVRSSISEKLTTKELPKSDNPSETVKSRLYLFYNGTKRLLTYITQYSLCNAFVPNLIHTMNGVSTVDSDENNNYFSTNFPLFPSASRAVYNYVTLTNYNFETSTTTPLYHAYIIPTCNSTPIMNPYEYISKRNIIPYTPTTDYNPATKKYVDDSSSFNSVNQPISIEPSAEFELGSGAEFKTIKKDSMLIFNGYINLKALSSGKNLTECVIVFENDILDGHTFYSVCDWVHSSTSYSIPIQFIPANDNTLNKDMITFDLGYIQNPPDVATNFSIDYLNFNNFVIF